MIAALQGSVSLDIPIYHIWSFTTACFALAYLMSRFAVPKIQLRRQQPPPTIAGEPLTYHVEIENCSRRVAYALDIMEMTIPSGLNRIRDISSPLIDRLAPHATKTLTLQLQSSQRGHYNLSGLYAASSYPLGLFRGLSFHVQEASVTVYPAHAIPDAFHLPLSPAITNVNRGAAISHAMAGTTTDFDYVRQYRHGDHPRHLHWASWARTGTPATKVYQQATVPGVGLVLDTAVQHARDLPALESAISAIAGIAVYLLQTGMAVDCFATDTILCRLSHQTPPTRRNRLMHTLAGLQASTSVDWSLVARHLLAHAPTCHTIALIALDWSQEIAGFVTRLHHHGMGVRTLVIREGPTSLPISSTAATSVLLPGNPWPQDQSRLPWRGP
jgi:uncharacterized protein (DUF58 family)